ncbi:MAG: hypothetical protein FK734_13070, partial [Asgard group archaeon]|nr:hypothetical protein [Asgard group archaeon]
MSANNKTKSNGDEEKIDIRLVNTWDEVKKYPVKKMIDYIGPTGIWLLSYYFASIFMMIVLNIARLGWTAEAIFAAPSYFAQIFINYGLNSGKIEAEPLDQENDFYYAKADYSNFLTSAAWLFAPMIIYILGIFINILPGSGYPQPIGDYDYLVNFQYFHDFVPFLNDTKTGGFYFLVAWLPMILSVIVGAFVSKRLFRSKRQINVNVLKIMLFNLIAAFIVGMQMGVMTGT